MQASRCVITVRMRIEFATRLKNKYNTENEYRRYEQPRCGMGIFVVLFASSMTDSSDR